MGNLDANPRVRWMPRKRALGAYAVLFLLLFSWPLLELVRYCINPEYSRYNSYILFIPFISGYLLYGLRDPIHINGTISLAYGVPLAVAGGVLLVASFMWKPVFGRTDALSLRTFSMVVCWIGGFLLLFGPQSFRIARFPLLFLLFLVPMPSAMMTRVNGFLQAASAEGTDLLFHLTSVPFFREGNLFQLPGLKIDIAPECSGMRATITLLVIGVLASHLFLRKAWKKFLVVASVLPITILGNSIRIVVLTLAAIYVDRNFIQGDSALHERGGWALFLVDLVILGVVVSVLRKEKETPSAETP